MKNIQKVYLAVAIVSVTVLYFTGLLWPLVRFCLTLAFVSSVVASGYFAYQAYISYRNLNSETNADRRPIHLTIAFAVSTLFFLLLLALAPVGSAFIQQDRYSGGSSHEGDGGREYTERSTADDDGGAVANTISRRNSDANRANPLMNIFAGAIQQEYQQRQQDQQRHNDRVIQSLTEKSKCYKCGGAGSYRYVDGLGQLRVNECPDCKGTGNAW
jgi:hypothetical protein